MPRKLNRVGNRQKNDWNKKGVSVCWHSDIAHHGTIGSTSYRDIECFPDSLGSRAYPVEYAE